MPNEYPVNGLYSRCQVCTPSIFESENIDRFSVWSFTLAVSICSSGVVGGAFPYQRTSSVTHTRLTLFPYRILLGSATLQFIISTIHIAAGLRSIIEGFILLKDPNGSILYWENNSRLVNVFQETATITNVSCFYIIYKYHLDIRLVHCVRHNNALEIICNLE